MGAYATGEPVKRWNFAVFLSDYASVESANPAYDGSMYDHGQAGTLALTDTKLRVQMSISRRALWECLQPQERDLLIEWLSTDPSTEVKVNEVGKADDDEADTTTHNTGETLDVDGDDEFSAEETAEALADIAEADAMADADAAGS